MATDASESDDVAPRSGDTAPGVSAVLDGLSIPEHADDAEAAAIAAAVAAHLRDGERAAAAPRPPRRTTTRTGRASAGRSLVESTACRIDRSAFPSTRRRTRGPQPDAPTGSESKRAHTLGGRPRWVAAI